MPAIIQKRIHSFLKHSLFVADYHLWRSKFRKSFQPVVSVNNASVEIIKIGSCESATVKWNQWTQFRRNDRNNIHNRPFRIVSRFLYRREQFQPLGKFLLFLF